MKVLKKAEGGAASDSDLLSLNRVARSLTTLWKVGSSTQYYQRRLDFRVWTMLKAAAAAAADIYYHRQEGLAAFSLVVKIAFI
jgi:hypothetical protein